MLIWIQKPEAYKRNPAGDERSNSETSSAQVATRQKFWGKEEIPMQQLNSHVTTKTLVLALSTFNSAAFSARDDHVLREAKTGFMTQKGTLK